MSEQTVVKQEPFEIRRKRELRAKVVELDDLMIRNREAVGELGICRTSSYAEAQEKLYALTTERGCLLAEWNKALAELAAL